MQKRKLGRSFDTAEAYGPYKDEELLGEARAIEARRSA
jgi:aryl-alcohol dehydrogenase-like predicted oxidoreductase